MIKFLLILFTAMLFLFHTSQSFALVILQYHHVSKETPPSTSISPEMFKKHLEIIEQKSYRVIGLTEAVSAIKSGEALPDKTILITFDDGYESVYSQAFPLLKKRKWPFVVFLNSQPIKEKNKGFVTLEQLKEMSDHGAAVANHTVTHAHLIRRLEKESLSDWRKRISKEILDAEVFIIEHLDQNHRTLAYPFGEYSAELEQLVSDLGFIGFGQQSGAVRVGERTDIPRFAFGGVYAEDIKAFTNKMTSLPMLIDSVKVLTEAGEPLKDGVLPTEVKRPVMVLKLKEGALNKAAINCFASGQGQIKVEKQTVKTGKGVLHVIPNKPLPSGRSRYNCTALDSASGRFHWFSYQFISRDKNGHWTHE